MQSVVGLLILLVAFGAVGLLVYPLGKARLRAQTMMRLDDGSTFSLRSTANYSDSAAGDGGHGCDAGDGGGHGG